MTKQLKGAFLSLTDRCNLHCKYCYQGSSPNVDTRDELKKDDWEKIILQLKNLGAGKLSFVGGEPSLYKDFLGILNYAHKKGFRIKIFTNGTLINKTALKRLKKLDAELSFNLNSHDEDVQDYFQEKGNWRKTVHAIQLCKKYKIKFEIASPIFRENIKHIDEFIDFCVKLGAKRIRLVPLILTGNAANLKEHKITKMQIEKLNKAMEKNKKIEITLGCRKCEAGTKYLTIQSNGDVTPCSLNKSVIGNVRKELIKNILKRARNHKYPKVCLD